MAEYLIDLNATEAAKRAGYSRKSAGWLGYQLLQKPPIAAAVEAGQAKQLAQADLSAVRVLEELRRLGFSDLAGAFDAQGALLPVTQIPEATRAAVASVKVTKKNLTAGDGKTEDVVEVKLWDKTRALESLAKHFGLLKESLEHSGEIRIRWAS